MKKSSKIIVVDKIEVSDIIMMAVKNDPIREIPEAKKLLDMPLDEYDAYMASLETAEE